MKSALLALGLLAALTAPAIAGACDTDLPALKDQLAKTEIQPDIKAQIQDMVAQAEKFCAAGNEQEAADVIADATSMLSSQ
ncbi:hypothetical protein [Aestuariivirga sp.]|uniref:hypothetical protein n=1 Tax=Aestuariivirga sp. TaxID=2650926 RepID=UPI0035AEB16E